MLHGGRQISQPETHQQKKMFNNRRARPRKQVDRIFLIGENASSHQGNEQKDGPQGVEMKKRLLHEIVGAGSVPIGFTIYQDRLQAETHHGDAIDLFGPDSSQARDAKAKLDDVVSRLHPMDR